MDRIFNEIASRLVNDKIQQLNWQDDTDASLALEKKVAALTDRAKLLSEALGAPEPFTEAELIALKRAAADKSPSADALFADSKSLAELVPYVAAGAQHDKDRAE